MVGYSATRKRLLNTKLFQLGSLEWGFLFINSDGMLVQTGVSFISRSAAVRYAHLVDLDVDCNGDVFEMVPARLRPSWTAWLIYALRSLFR